MKYFLTGISGFIGSNLARQLVAGGHRVNAIIRGPEPEEFREDTLVRFFKGDLHNVEILKQAMDGCDVAFHLAAYAKPWAKNPGDFHRINVEGAANVFEAALASGIKKVIFTSTAGTTSPSPGPEPVDESCHRTIPFFNEYESTKAEAEEVAREYCRKGLQIVIVNPTRVYGPGPLNASNSLTKMIDSYRKGSWRIIPGDGLKTGNYVFIDNVVNGHMLAAEKGRAGEKYILGGENLTFNELFGVLASVTGKKRRMLHLPLNMMLFISKIMIWQNKVTGISPAITPGFVRKYMVNWSLTSDKATRELGYRVTSFEKGSKMTLEWLAKRD
jgi:farnesol dehydrogenase